MKILTQGLTVSLACYVQLCRSTWQQECMLWMKGFSCDFILWRVLERYPSLVSLSYHDVCSIRPFVVVYIVLPKSCITFYQKYQKQYQRWIITIIFVYSLRPKQMTTLGLNPIKYFCYATVYCIKHRMSLNRVIVPFNKSFQNYFRRCLLYHSLIEQLKYIF